MAEKPYLPNPGQEATSSDAPEMIAINREVEKELEKKQRKRRGDYHQCDGELRAKIGRYAAENGNHFVVKKFSKEFGGSINESNVRGFKKAGVFDYIT